MSPTPSEKTALLFLSAVLLVGIGVSYYRKNCSPFSLKVTSSSPMLREQENAFETSKKISLMKGTAEDFVRLPYVGPELAKRIVAYRETHGFQKKEDMTQVKGIGAKTYEVLKDLLVFE